MVEREFSKLLTSDSFITKNIHYFGSKWRNSPDYFCFHKLFEAQIKKDSRFEQCIKEMPFKDSWSVLCLALRGWNKDLTSEECRALETSPMFKFSYSVDEPKLNPNSSFAFLIGKDSEIINKSFIYNHLHTSTSIRTTYLYNSFVNSPTMVKEITGSFDSESDLRVVDERFKRFHVYNTSSLDGKNDAQILIPYASNRLFLRHQNGNTFSAVREVAWKDEIEDLKKEIEKLKNKRNFWQKVKKWLRFS